MITLLALRNLTHRPWRTVLLFLGYGLGVGVMIVLLAIGSAMLTQASDEKLVGGGQITVLPEGIDVEVMKTGGVGGLFFSIANSRFVYRQLLAAPRLAGSVQGVAPQIDGKLLYLRTPSGAEYAVRARGEIPTRQRLVGAASTLAAGAWNDDSLDREWRDPTVAEVRRELDHFHLPPENVAARESWAEWHYFNVLSADRRRWAFLSFILTGDVGRGRWGAQVLLTTHEEGRPSRRFVSRASPEHVRFSTESPDLRIGDASVTLLDDGRYRVHARAREEGGAGAMATIDLIVAPAPRAYLPGTSIGGDALVSGYAVGALRADATGSLCIDGACERYVNAQSYHDHNWGLWRGVTWDWGAARAGSFTVLYGRVLTEDSASAGTPLVLFLVDSLGFRAIFRPQRIAYDDARTILVDGREVRVPARATIVDVRGDDTLSVSLEIEDAVGSDSRLSGVQRGERGAPPDIAHPYFIQMKGLARLSGRVGGVSVSGVGAGFFETYR